MSQHPRKIYDTTVLGYRLTLDEDMGHAAVYHDGDITWDILQAIKTELWGPEAVAIEVYPPQSKIVNNVNARHLWRLGEGEFYPDLLGEDDAQDSLHARYRRVWTTDTMP